MERGENRVGSYFLILISIMKIVKLNERELQAKGGWPIFLIIAAIQYVLAAAALIFT